MKHKFYYDGTLKPVCEMLLQQALYHNCLTVVKGNTLTAHLTPCTLFINTLHGILQCAGQQWAGRQEQRAFTSMYKCTHRTKEKEGIVIPKNGDLTADVSTQSSTYIKTSTKEEKFQY
jgi:hypothetical protein